MSAKPDAPADLIVRAEQRIADLVAEGMKHLQSVDGLAPEDHLPGPDPQCPACDDIYGEANILRDLAATVQQLQHQLELCESECGLRAKEQGRLIALREAADTHREALTATLDVLEKEIRLHAGDIQVMSRDSNALVAATSMLKWANTLSRLASPTGRT